MESSPPLKHTNTSLFSNSESTTWSSLQERNGCMKVCDPYYGKRKQSVTLKRIQRKIQLSNQNKTTLGDSELIKGREKLDIIIEREQNGTNIHDNLQKKSGQQVQNAMDTSLLSAHKQTEEEAANLWLTQEELLSIFYRCL